MLHEWLELREDLMRAMTHHRALCHAPQPDLAALSQARWQLSSISRQRTEWSLRVAGPAAERLAHTPGGAAWLAVQADMLRYRQRISAFVARWPSDAVVTDWSGYQQGVVALRGEVAQWLRLEEAAIRALAAAMDAALIASPPPRVPQAMYPR